MKKLNMHTTDITQSNVDKIREMFPGCVTETQDKRTGESRWAVNFDLLRQELSANIVEGPQERYHLDWPGKRQAMIAANASTTKVLRPVRAESVGFDTTRNLFVEGDNLEAMKVLQEIYLGKVQLIYIDPPYNKRKNSFVYKDDYSITKQDHKKISGQEDEFKNQLVSNPETEPRFHTNWLNMIYPRINLAKKLLSEDGFLFVSIDESEVGNLRKVCDEIFGETNFVSEMIIITGSNQAGKGVMIQTNNEYCLVYAKNKSAGNINHVDPAANTLRNLNDAPTNLEQSQSLGYTIYFNPKTNDILIDSNYDKSKIHTNKETEVYTDDLDLINKGYTPVRPGKRNNKLHRWRWSANEVINRKDELVFEKSKSGKYVVKFRQKGFNAPKNVLNFSAGTNEMKSIFDGQKIFDFPKSTKLIQRILEIASQKDSIVMDFFAGTSTTAHATMQQNAKDGGNRRFIMIQLDEKVNPKSEASKSGFSTIAEISKERIRRAGTKIIVGKCHPEWNRDVGFRVLKTDSSNMEDVKRCPDELEQEELFKMSDNIKPGRTAEDLLFNTMLQLGIDLSSKIQHKTINGRNVFFVNDNELVACFDTYSSSSPGVNMNLAHVIIEHNPQHVVFRDAGFQDDAEMTNVEQLFAQLSPNTNLATI